METSHHHSGHNHAELILKLINCAMACENCSSACLDEDDVAMMAHCIELDRDCADICSQAARLLKRDSEIGHPFLVVCEEICRRCAAECEKHDKDHCKKCAEACRDCAEACHAHHGEFHLR